MAVTSLEIANGALLAIGDKPMQSFDEATAAAETMRILYPQERDALLACHPWSFARGEADLAEEAAALSERYGKTFALPGDCLGVREAIGRPDFEIHGRSANTDAATLRIVYTRRVPETWFPPAFVKALAARLAAEACVALSEDSGRAVRLAQQAALELSRAKLADSQQDTPRAIDDYTLVAFR